MNDTTRKQLEAMAENHKWSGAQVQRLVNEATRSSDERYESFLEAFGASSLVEVIEKGKWRKE